MLWGGNLSLLAHLAGTPYFPQIDDGILYVEEIAEEPYAVERIFLQLYHAGVLQRQRALVLGDFTDCKPTNPVALSVLDGRSRRDAARARSPFRC